MNVLRENLFRSFCASDGKFLSFSSHEFFSGGVVESWGAGIQVKSLFFQTGLPSPSPPPQGDFAGAAFDRPGRAERRLEHNGIEPLTSSMPLKRSTN